MQRKAGDSPLELLARAVMDAKINRERAEAELARVPRWRFVRRAQLERRVNKRRRREQHLLGWMKDPVGRR